MTADFGHVSVAVVGSVNLDIVARVEKFPVPGETVTNAVVNRYPGGKGGNQALAAHRLGAEVYMLACLGQDAAAEEALATLSEEGVDLGYCRELEGASTGLAMILVSSDGENQIVVAPGANAAFTPALLEMPSTDAVIAQLEVPMETVRKAAGKRQAFFCLNAAPAREVPADVLALTDLLVVNEIELLTIGQNPDSFKGLLATTYGARGAVLSREGKELARAKPPRVDAIDTTGAGDCFTAALTVALVSGLDYGKALKLACTAAAISTTRPGAQSSPLASELGDFFK